VYFILLYNHHHYHEFYCRKYEEHLTYNISTVLYLHRVHKNTSPFVSLHNSQKN